MLSWRSTTLGDGCVWSLAKSFDDSAFVSDSRLLLDVAHLGAISVLYMPAAT